MWRDYEILFCWILATLPFLIKVECGNSQRSNQHQHGFGDWLYVAYPEEVFFLNYFKPDETFAILHSDTTPLIHTTLLHPLYLVAAIYELLFTTNHRNRHEMQNCFEILHFIESKRQLELMESCTNETEIMVQIWGIAIVIVITISQQWAQILSEMISF